VIGEQSVDHAQFTYGFYLANGRSVAIDLIRAAKYDKLAPDQNLADAQCPYGFCRQNGSGVEMNLEGATGYYRWAAGLSPAVGCEHDTLPPTPHSGHPIALLLYCSTVPGIPPRPM
jgi:TPR repeat protein